MEANKRIILNTSVQYIKAIVTTILSLFSMRIVLEAIGVSDYGIFSVVGGVIAMLGFITTPWSSRPSAMSPTIMVATAPAR